MHYRKSLFNVPSGCDGYGAHLLLDHALVCRKGGLIIQCHNGVRDADDDLPALIWSRVASEPFVRGASVDSEAFCSYIIQICILFYMTLKQT